MKNFLYGLCGGLGLIIIILLVIRLVPQKLTGADVPITDYFTILKTFTNKYKLAVYLFGFNIDSKEENIIVRKKLENINSTKDLLNSVESFIFNDSTYRKHKFIESIKEFI